MSEQALPCNAAKAIIHSINFFMRLFYPLPLDRLENQFRVDLNRRLQTAVDRTMIRKEAVNTLGRFAMSLFRLQSQSDVNSFYDQDILLKLHFTHRLGDKALVRRIDLTRLQRASKGSRKSTGRSRDHVIQSRGVRFQHVRRDFIMFATAP